MKLGKELGIVAVVTLLAVSTRVLRAQDAKSIVQEAVNAEMAAARDDHSHWEYTDHHMDGDNSVYIAVETSNGTIKEHIERNGHPASETTIGADKEHIQQFIHDPSMQEKQRQNGAHDDKSAAELLNLLPQAFNWKVESETSEDVTLHFSPAPDFTPPDMESRVMGAMAGTMIVVKKGNRIRTFKGNMQNDVTIAFGLLARIKAGSTFDIERRQVAPGYWEITQTHVHISGHALFFKTIGQQEDDVKTHFNLMPEGTTLEQAVGILDEAVKAATSK